jgi:nucleotide-binding universal stress UspA family protein
MPFDFDDTPADDRPLVVVGFDGSEAAARAIAVATTLMAGADILVVCVYRSLLDAAGVALLGASEELVRGGARALDAQRRHEAQQTAERGAALAAADGSASEALALAATGAVWAAIEHLAEQRRAAAVVVGERRLSGLGRIVLGSVSSGLVHHATLPVLVVPDTGDARRRDGEAAQALAGVPDPRA